MTTAACKKWSGLFSVGEEFDDEDLLEADWIKIPGHASVSVSPVSVPLETPPTTHNARLGVQNSGSVPSSSAPDTVPVDTVPVDTVPVDTALVLGSASRCLSALASSSGPSPEAPLGVVRAPPRAHTPPAPPDDFDEWDVDLEELNECVDQRAVWPPHASAHGLQSDRVSPAKRMKTSSGEFRRAAPLPSPAGPRAPVTCSRVNAPPHPLGVAAPPPGQMRAVTPLQSRGRAVTLFQTTSPAPSPALTPRPLRTPVLTNHLVQLMCAANKTPQRPKSDSGRTKTRRFPGPAGMLPQQLSGHGLDDIVVTVPQTPAHGAVARLRSEVPSSQGSEEEEFSGGMWAAMKAEMGLDERDPSCFLHSYSIVMVLRKAALRQLPKNKVPNMAVVLKSIAHTHADAKAVFRDPTGEMQGTVHRCLLEDRYGELKTGAVLLLKQVGVFSPSHRNHYLNVTPNNLLRIYSPDGAVHTPSQLAHPVLEPAGLLPLDSSRPEGGAVSQMELYYDEEEEANEQAPVPDHTIPAPGVAQPPPGSDNPDQGIWGGDDDLDELFWDLPVD